MSEAHKCGAPACCFEWVCPAKYVVDFCPVAGYNLDTGVRKG
jgi:hypothetical protein